MFEQKGLFQADVSIHHALCTTALQNYHTSAQQLQNGSPPDPLGGPVVDDLASAAQLGNSELPINEWGFEHMSERIAAAQEASAEGLKANAEGPIVRLPHLQVLRALCLTSCLWNTACPLCRYLEHSSSLHTFPVLPASTATLFAPTIYGQDV